MISKETGVTAACIPANVKCVIEVWTRIIRAETYCKNVNYKKNHHWVDCHCFWFTIKKFPEGREQKYQLSSPFTIFLGNHCKDNIVLDIPILSYPSFVDPDWSTLTCLIYLPRGRHHQRVSYSFSFGICLLWLMQKQSPSPRHIRHILTRTGIGLEQAPALSWFPRGTVNTCAQQELLCALSRHRSEGMKGWGISVQKVKALNLSQDGMNHYRNRLSSLTESTAFQVSKLEQRSSFLPGESGQWWLKAWKGLQCARWSG